MNSLKKTILRDLLENNAHIGYDGGIWYPSGPEQISLESILVDMVAPRGILNKKALTALIKAANIMLEDSYD